MTLVRGNGLAAWRQVADAIRTDIVEGRLVAGQLIGTEAALAQRFGVNRHTIRHGLAHLAEHGLVRALQGRGTFVSETARAASRSGAPLATETLPKPGREARGELVYAGHANADDAIAAALSIVPGAPVLEMHTLARDGAHPVAFGVTFAPLPRFLGLDQLFAARGSLVKAYRKSGVDEVQRLSARIRTSAADAREAAALDIAPGRALLVLTSINTDADAIPVQHTRLCFPADRVELSFDRR